MSPVLVCTSRRKVTMPSAIVPSLRLVVVCSSRIACSSRGTMSSVLSAIGIYYGRGLANASGFFPLTDQRKNPAPAGLKNAGRRLQVIIGD
jgi:hypothetical protein